MEHDASAECICWNDGGVCAMQSAGCVLLYHSALHTYIYIAMQCWTLSMTCGAYMLSIWCTSLFLLTPLIIYN